MRLISFANIQLCRVQCTWGMCVWARNCEKFVQHSVANKICRTVDKAIYREISGFLVNMYCRIWGSTWMQTCQSSNWNRRARNVRGSGNDGRKRNKNGMMRRTRKMFEQLSIIRQIGIDHMLTHTCTHMSAWWLRLSITKKRLPFDYFARNDAGSLNLFKSCWTEWHFVHLLQVQCIECSKAKHCHFSMHLPNDTYPYLKISHIQTIHIIIVAIIRVSNRLQFTNITQFFLKLYGQNEIGAIETVT